MKQKTYLPGRLCDRVRDLREEKGLTRKELAEHSGVNESLLGRIENNKNRKVSDEAVQALAKFFLLSVLTYSIVGRLCIQAEKIAAV